MKIEGDLACACLHGNEDQICIVDDGRTFHEIHMGTPLEAWIDDAWIPTRIELNSDDEYYLVGIGKEIAWLHVRADL